ncbi:MAG: hypothetical protein HQL29_04970 [Candidatus Omnitrophica bacterium]|nr:hypothetical protein [Candidatus Omnitrophota bacterium]
MNYNNTTFSRFKNLVTPFLSHIDYIFLPFIFWIVRNAFWKPFGPTAEYNQVALNNTTLLKTFQGMQTNLAGVFKIMADICMNNMAAFLGLSFVVFIVLKKFLCFPETDKKSNFRLALLGLLFLFLGVFPYSAVGKVPVNLGWESRLQLLLPLGLAFMSVFTINILTAVAKPLRAITPIIFSFLLSSMILTNNSIYWAYHADWYKQLSMVENYKNNIQIKNYPTQVYIIVDAAPLKGVSLTKHPHFFLWEHVGLFKKAYGETYKIGVPGIVMGPGNLLLDKTNWGLMFRSMDDIKFNNQPPVIVLRKGSYDIDLFKNHLRLLYYQIFNKKKFIEDLGKVINISFLSYGNFIKSISA